MEYTYRPKGVCSMQIKFEMEGDGVVKNIRFLGGCSGNTQGVARLAENRKADEVIALLSGIRCGGKGTSCPDQLAEALKEAIG
ncbi:MAG: TIGR03905 family TSCPD domain-containing protein [Clostridia bacterium]|nr:TIGR03905 family TSCPD domain-containing protein [Clostridia bacterium]